MAETERGRSPSGVSATAPRKLVGFGPATWQRLKDILRQLAPPPPRRWVKRRPAPRPERDVSAPRPVPVPVGRPIDIEPRRQPEDLRWNRVAEFDNVWRDLDRRATDRFQRWLRGEL